MSTATAPRPAVRYRALFPAWEGRRPLSWFFAEELLEARAASDFPTNRRLADEDVNIYLIQLLTGWATSDPRPGILPGRDPILTAPPEGRGPRDLADRYRRQADHRLLSLGLFDRGDLVRRRLAGWRMTVEETRRKDLAVAEHCYGLAADLLATRGRTTAGTVAVWRKLAAHLPDYVGVLQTLARRRLGLGARLGDAELARLLAIPAGP